MRDVELGLLPCDARLLAARAWALTAAAAGNGSPPPLPFDGRVLLQAHPAALALDADELREGLARVLRLLPAAAREDPTALAMAAVGPLVALSEQEAARAAAGAAGRRGRAPPPAAASSSSSPERVALAYEELGAVVSAASAGRVRMGPRLFAWLFDQQQQQQQQQQGGAPLPSALPSLAAGVAALARALGGAELASAALERAPELCMASGDAEELIGRVRWLRDRLGLGGDDRRGSGAGGLSNDEPLFLLLLPARLAAALSTASCPDASADRALVRLRPARSNPRDPSDLPIRPLEALTRDEYAGRAPEHALSSCCSSPLSLPSPDEAAAAAARLLRRRVGWPPGAAVRFLRAYPGALAWDWSPGGACDSAYVEVERAAARRGGRWPVALRSSPAAVAAALASPPRARRRLAYLSRAPAALAGVGLRRALAMPEVDFLEACPGYLAWRWRGWRVEEDEGAEGDEGGGRASTSPSCSSTSSSGSVFLLGDLRETDRML
jgi:hypothetical protein